MTASKIGFTEGIGLSIASFAFEEDAITKHMERIAPGAGVVTVGAKAFTSISATGVASATATSVIGKGRIVICSRAVTGNTDYATFRLVYKDAAGVVLGVGPLTQISFAELTSGGSPDYRFGTLAVFANDACASSVEFLAVTLPASGQMDVRIFAA